MIPEQLATLHARCFAVPRPWHAAEFSALLETAGCFLLIRPVGFLLGRAIAGEAELLTLAVDPDARRRGTGRSLTQEFALAAKERGAKQMFLEVASDNLPAQFLYKSQGWEELGQRPDYYAPGVDAIAMRLCHVQ